MGQNARLFFENGHLPIFSCNPKNKLECKCLPGFKPNAPEKWDSGDFSDGCIRNSMSCSENDMFFPVFQKTWDNPNSESIAEDDSACKKECLSSCDC